MQEPSSASGGTTALTRLPSARRASTIGADSSMRRPTADDDLLAMMRMCARRGTRWSTARAGRALDEGMFGPLTRMSVIVSSRSSGLERAEAEHFVDDVGGERALLGLVQRQVALVGDLADQPLDAHHQLGRGHARRLGRVDAVEHLAVDRDQRLHSHAPDLAARHFRAGGRLVGRRRFDRGSSKGSCCGLPSVSWRRPKRLIICPSSSRTRTAAPGRGAWSRPTRGRRACWRAARRPAAAHAGRRRSRRRHSPCRRPSCRS